MQASITITSQDLIKLLEEKYPNLQIYQVWFKLLDTKEHWEQKNNRKLENGKDILEFESNDKTIRIFQDGAFDEAMRKRGE